MASPTYPARASPVPPRPSDFQPQLLANTRGPEHLLQQAQRAQRVALQADLQEVHVRVAFTPEQHTAVPAHNKAFAPLAHSGYLAEGTPAANVQPLLRTSRRAHSVTKTHVSGFSPTNLDTPLREQGIDTLVLAGILTFGVVLPTIRDAVDRYYRLLVLGDVCADSDPTRHEQLIRSIIPLHADVLDVADFATLIDTQPADANTAASLRSHPPAVALSTSPLCPKILAREGFTQKRR